MKYGSFLALVCAALLLTGCPMPEGDSSLGPFGNPNPPGSEPPSSTVLAYEQDAFEKVNDERTSRGLDALVMRNDLREVARAHSEDMVARGYFDHVNPDGDDPFDRMADVGITYNTAGENIAWNNFSNPVDTAVNGWMNSSGHRANILRTSFTHTGMGVAHDGSGGYYFTQVFIGVSKDVPKGYVDVWYYPPE